MSRFNSWFVAAIVIVAFWSVGAKPTEAFGAGVAMYIALRLLASPAWKGRQ